MRIPSFLGLMLMSLFLCISCDKGARSSFAGDNPMPPLRADELTSDGGNTNSQPDGGSSTVLPGTGSDAGYCVLGAQICNNQCVNGNYSQKHCGGGGNVCAPGEICTYGDCTGITTFLSDGGVACDVNEEFPGWGIILCGNECKTSFYDNDNCGSCGNKCKATEECQRGQCLTQCGDSCVSLDIDPYHCGVCGNACPSDHWCENGVCEKGPPLLCLAGEVECDKKCTELDKDLEHCGACNNACDKKTESCVNGICLAR